MTFNNKISFRFLMLLVPMVFVIIACSEDEDNEPNPELFPKADFMASTTSVQAGESVTFTDLSTNNPYLWTWDFQGANPTYSNEQNPVVIYEAQGSFSVTMKSRNEFGADEITKTKYIEVTAPPIPYLANYPFSGSLEDLGNNGITAMSTYGEPSYENDRKGQSNEAWVAPGVGGQNLEIPGWKGIGGDGARTIMAWFKTPEGGSRKTIVSWGVNSAEQMFNVMIHTNRVRIEAGASNLRSLRADLDDDAWHHLAVVYDPSFGDKLANVKIYLDGVLDPGTPDGSGNSFNSEVRIINTDNTTNDVKIGDAIYSTNYAFIGSLDDVRIIDVALSLGEIQAIYLE